MAHVTANGTETTQAIAYAGEDVPEARADPLLRDAERAVRDIAPPPDPVPEQYRQDASDGEKYMFAFYVSQPGYLSSASMDGISVNFASAKDGSPATERVKAIMSRWIRGTPPRATVSAQRYSNVLTEKDRW